MRLLTSPDQLREVLEIPFSDEQMAAIVEPPHRQQAIIAGAGSGKTAVMAARVVWLVGYEEIDPATILGLTFTAKAAGELAMRVRASLMRIGDFSEHGEPTISTYHAFAGTLIAEHGLRLGVEPDLRVLADATRFQIAARVVRDHTGTLTHVSAWMPTTITDLLALDGQLSEHLVGTDELRAFDERMIAEAESVAKQLKLHRDVAATSRKRIELSRLVDDYRAAKLEAGVMDFSDQMAWGARLAQLPEVQQSLRDRFDVVLLDEYQDTSVAQRDLLRAVFAGQGISAVGDPAQGIYGWRGAASGNLAAFLDDFAGEKDSPGTRHALSVTRRCAPEIIDLAAVVAREYYEDDAVKPIVTPLRAAPENPPGEVTVALHMGVAEEIDALVDAVAAAGERARETGADHLWRDIAILVRATAENTEIVRALRARQIPVEIVGLTGLLSQPEILDVFAVLEVLDDVTANPSMLRLLAGPRWRIGDRDLALLGRRAADLGRVWTASGADAEQPDEQLLADLAEATAGADPTEVVSLAEAVEDPGDLPYSDEARRRFADLASLLARLRRHVHEPLSDLARRAVAELDLDVELTVSGAGSDNLALLLDAISDYAQHDRYASLTGLLAYLRAETDFNRGMELSAPSEADSVKVLTIHKSKGLEFDEVFVPFVSAGVFPDDKGRSRWISNASVLPVGLRGDAAFVPDLEELSREGEEDFKRRNKADALMEEIRLGYVAFTRARYRLHVSGHRWGRTQVRPRQVSRFLSDVREWLAERGTEPLVWAAEPEADATNPHIDDTVYAWPVTLRGMESRRAFAGEVRSHLKATEALPLTVHPELQQIRAELDLLIEEAERAQDQVVEVPLPDTLSATQTLALAEDPDAFARSLARPLPRRPSGAARFGTRFHAWIEARYGQQTLLDPEELPGAPGTDIVDISDDGELEALKKAFESGLFADREPAAVEVPFTLRLGGQQVLGRIDAVFTTDDGFEIVDWKTNRRADADPLQLAVYRLAWAEMHDIDPARVTAAFYYVRTDELQRPDELPGREELAIRLGLR
ncbi:ATP-dependent DNA helicase [Aeromicrobium piscarium]|uniref:DNA 3'-5' helicase n=1 Tax=Aeromicrobium piscarium TaxID=2590901 RepID=A0A554SHI6_9ACTN|nr:ATP-dependent DNA helicase [Aeromicrobium piscarium]TSD65764.1 ATP-dependent helicase [Aeromicrobium piscarium]